MSAHFTGKKLLTIVGATASGKSAASILVAQRFHGEVINCDSRLFYRGLEIGTAMPSEQERSAVPHHLVSFLSPTESYSLAQFLADARRTVLDLHERGTQPVLVGGTGQYVWGLLEGWQVPEVPPNLELRTELEHELEERGVDALYERLEALDPQIAASVDAKNHRRIIRAIERIASGTAQDHREAIDPGYDSLLIGLHVERSELHRRIAERIDQMLASGWLDEVNRLIDDGIDFSLPAMSAIGYRELAAVIRGEITIGEARERTIRATNRLVRHQNNWFKQSDGRINWVDVTDGDLSRVLEPVEHWLK